MRALLPALLLLTATPAAAQPAALQPVAAAFSRLAVLAGEWRPADQPDSTLRIRFYLTASGTVLVEEWTKDGRPHSLTLYHRDGQSLIATHYCPQGNQPRLALDQDYVGPLIRFGFRDATDLDPGEAAQHDLAFDLSDPARVIRSEVYRKDGKDEPSTLSLVRVGG